MKKLIFKKIKPSVSYVYDYQYQSDFHVIKNDSGLINVQRFAFIAKTGSQAQLKAFFKKQ